jgi:hypothetical protein
MFFSLISASVFAQSPFILSKPLENIKKQDFYVNSEGSIESRAKELHDSKDFAEVCKYIRDNMSAFSDYVAQTELSAEDERILIYAATIAFDNKNYLSFLSQLTSSGTIYKKQHDYLIASIFSAGEKSDFLFINYKMKDVKQLISVLLNDLKNENEIVVALNDIQSGKNFISTAQKTLLIDDHPSFLALPFANLSQRINALKVMAFVAIAPAIGKMPAHYTPHYVSEEKLINAFDLYYSGNVSLGADNALTPNATLFLDSIYSARSILYKLIERSSDSEIIEMGIDLLYNTILIPFPP